MSVSLEKGPMPAPEGEQSSVDYAGMYKEAQPDAVEDIKKAEFMASAMDKSETERRTASHAALVDAMNDRPDHEIARSLDAAQASREQADLVAEKVSNVYDQIQHLKS